MPHRTVAGKAFAAKATRPTKGLQRRPAWGTRTERVGLSTAASAQRQRWTSERRRRSLAGPRRGKKIQRYRRAGESRCLRRSSSAAPPGGEACLDGCGCPRACCVFIEPKRMQAKLVTYYDCNVKGDSCPAAPAGRNSYRHTVMTDRSNLPQPRPWQVDRCGDSGGDNRRI